LVLQVGSSPARFFRAAVVYPPVNQFSPHVSFGVILPWKVLPIPEKAAQKKQAAPSRKNVLSGRPCELPDKMAKTLQAGFLLFPKERAAPP
jgi:hypothetical protein